jgi:hypothetical protein
VWAVQHANSGTTVQFESGVYDYTNPSYLILENATLEPAPGAASRPIIKQTVAFKSCSCPTILSGGTAVVRGLEIDQAAGEPGNAAGAIAAGKGLVLERDILEGVVEGMYFTGTGTLDDSLVIAGDGTAIDLSNEANPVLNNVTAIAKGNSGGAGVALEVYSASKGSRSVTATNTILRGETADAEVYAPEGTAAIVLHYSDARTAEEKVGKGLGTQSITDTDHPTHAEPLFVAGGYEEAAGSPTIDAGTLDPASGSLDLAGLPRALGSATDIGAYEYQPPAAPVTKEAPPAGKPGVSTPPPVPTLGSLAQSHPRWRPGSKLAVLTAAARPRAPLGTTFSFALNTPATVSFSFRRVSGGRRSAHGCVAPTPRNRRARACTRRLKAGGLTLSVPAGADRLAFFGRLSRTRRLAPGRYTVTVQASNASGSSKASSLSFTIV